MKKLYCFLFSVVLWLGFSASTLASTKGTDFWYAHIDQLSLQTTGITRCYLYIYAEHPTTVQAHAPTTNWDTSVTALPGLTILILPRDVINTGWFITHGYGVHITAGDSVSIVAHIGNGAIDQNGSSHKEAALLLPVSTLGYEYYVASSRVIHDFTTYSSTSKLIVVATEDNTEVEITPSDTTVPEYPVGVPFTITLNRGEMFGLNASPYLKDTMKDTTSDLTGSYIRATAPIAVFGGTFGVASILKGSRSGLDYAFEQMTPVSMLGREYILTPVLGTPQPYLCRIFAMYDSTKVIINNNPEMLLHKGQIYDLETQEALFVQSDKPVNVYQYIQNIGKGVEDSLNFAGNAFVAVQPIEQMALREVMFTDVPFNLPRRQTFVNIILRTADLSSLIELDGIPINETFIPIPAKPEYSYARLRIPYGRDEHHIASLKPFMAYAYGSGSNLPHSSNASQVYLHSLGGGSRNLLLTAQATPDTLCPDSTVTFTAQIDMALDTAGAVWLWDFGDGNTAQGQNTQHRYTSSGVYTITLTVRKGTFLLVDPVHLTVTVATPKVQSSSQLLDFGRVSPCADAPAQEVILHNTGSRQAVITTSWASTTGFFSVEALPLTLAVEDSQNLRLRFNSPGIAGIYRDTLRLPIEPCGDVLEIAVLAEVLPGSISLQPVPVLFGVLSGCSKAQKDTTLTIRNTGKQDITISSALIAAPFSVLNLPAPVLIPVGQEYILSLRFTPMSPGVYTQQLQIAYTYAECDDTLRVSVSGELRGIPIEVSTRTDTTICPGGVVQLYATGGVRYQWTPTDGLNDATSATPMATPKRTTRYTVTATNETGCTGSSVVLVEVQEAIRLQTTGGSTCKGGTVQLAASGAERYLWSPQDGLDDPTSATPISSVQTTTVYTVTGWSQECSTTAQVTVEVLPPPVVTVRPDTSICMGESVVLTTEVQTNNEVRYQWQPSIGLDDPTSATPVVTPLVTTLYTVEVTDNNDCSSSAQVQVEVREPSKLSVVVPDVLAAGERFVLPVMVKSPPQSLPLQDVQLRVDITYPSRMMFIESVSGGLIRQDRKISDDLHVISIETTSRSLVDVQTEICVIHARALLTEQKEGQLQPVLVEVLTGECIVPDDEAGGVLKVNGYCEAHDYRKFEPLTVQINPQPVDRESRIEVRTSIAGEYRASLYDSYGRVVWQSTWQQQNGVVHSEVVNTDVSSTGIYLLRVEGEGQTAAQTVMIVR